MIEKFVLLIVYGKSLVLVYMWQKRNFQDPNLQYV